MAAVGREAHELRGTVNRNASLNTNRFAKFTANALFLVNHGDFEKFGRIGAGLHGNTVERTNINAKLASRTGFRIDFSFGNG